MLATNATITIETIICCVCGVAFGLPSTLAMERRSNKQSVYCPNGHDLALMVASDSAEAKLKKELEREKQRREMAEREAKYEAERANKAEAKTDRVKAERKRILKRIANGVCPHCNRSFEDLHRHMNTKHADVKP